MLELPQSNVDYVDTLSAATFNGLASELNNAVTHGGLTWSGSDNEQISKSIANNIAGGKYYVEDSTSVANAYVLKNPNVASNDFIYPTGYFEGMDFYVYITNANTGASTLNINSIGTVAIKTKGGSALSGGELFAGFHKLVYDGTQFIIADDIGFKQSFGTSGNIRFPNGYIRQWGKALVPNATSLSITFPQAFPNAVFGVCAFGDNSYVYGGGYWSWLMYSGTGPSLTGFVLDNCWADGSGVTTNAYWEAWGN